VGAEADPADDRLDGGVEQCCEVGRRVRVDRRRRVVDLDECRTSVGERDELRPEDRHECLGGLVPVGVDLARSGPQPAGQRVRPGDGDLERSRRARDGRAELGDDAEPIRRGDRLEDGEAVLLVVTARPQPAVRGQRRDTRQVPVELGGEEAGAAHLAVGHDVDAGALLVAQRDIDGVVVQLGGIGRPELAALDGGDARDEPARPGVRSDDARQEPLAHPPLPSAIANTRAGFSTNSRRRAAASMPAASISALKPSSSQVRPGLPPYTA
jgi:hypothetical protein